MSDENWKLNRELSRLQLDIDNMQRSMNTYATRIKKRIEIIKEYAKDSNTKKQLSLPLQ